MEYPTVFEPDREAGGFVITFPDLPWGVTQAGSTEEGIVMAADLLELVIGECIRRGEDLPRARRLRSARVKLIRMPAMATAKAKLYSAWRASGISKAELARQMGISRTNVDRLFDFKHHSRLDQIESAFGVLGLVPRRTRASFRPARFC